MNEILNEIIDPKDTEIAILKQKIENFKEYDKQRKAYYAGLAQRVGELESYVQELEDTNGIQGLYTEFKGLKSMIKSQNKRIKALKSLVSSEHSKQLLETIEPQDISKIFEYTNQISKLKSQISRQKKSISKLIQMLYDKNPSSNITPEIEAALSFLD